jgi:hypothetical protein
LAICNPLFTFSGSTPFQLRSISSSKQGSYDSVCCWRKQLQLQQQQQLKTRRDVHRPLQAVLHDLACRGFQIEW